MSSMNGGFASDEVLRLVKTVGQLDSQDQERILKLVRLLALASPTVQDETHRMLRSLLQRKPHTMYECVTAVDELIEHLETSLRRSRSLDHWQSLDRVEPERWN